MAKASDNAFPSVLFDEQGSTPSTPAAGNWRLYTKSDGLYLVDDAGDVTGPFGTGSDGGGGAKYPADGRLTLETGVPVSVTDQTAKTTLYYSPYVGDQIALYSGSVWEFVTFAELSIAVPATTSQMYDIFIYNDGGTATLELTAWTNDTTRATALVRQNGILCKTGALTRRYVGSFRTTGSSGQTEDSLANRFVYNEYHQVPRKGVVINTSSHTYTTTTIREWNGSSSRVGIVLGQAQTVNVRLHNQTSDGSTFLSYGAGVDRANNVDVCSYGIILSAYENIGQNEAYSLAPGYHYIASTEYGAGGVTFSSTTIGYMAMM